MECNVVKDLIPLYIDDCCSEESEKIVKEHIKNCDSCKKLLEDMETPSDMVEVSKVPIKMNKINDWKASIMQSILLFVSFAIITIGVALEARTPYTPLGIMNGYWALNLVVPATGFMLSLANWYFVRLYKNRKRFSDWSCAATFGITLGAWIWTVFHYHIGIYELIAGVLLLYKWGILLAAVFCFLSKILSNKYAKMLGKE